MYIYVYKCSLQMVMIFLCMLTTYIQLLLCDGFVHIILCFYLDFLNFYLNYSMNCFYAHVVILQYMYGKQQQQGGGCLDFAPDAGNKKAICKGRLWWSGGRERFNPFTLALWSTRGVIISWLWLCERGGGGNQN